MKEVYLALAMLAAVLTGCARQRVAADANGDAMRVGGRHFTEQLVLGQITMQALRANGIPAVDKTGLPDAAAIRRALEDGEIDVHWGSIGTAWNEIMDMERIENGAGRWMFERVRDADALNAIVWTEPATLANRLALVMTRDRSRALGIRSLSELGEFMTARPGTLSLAGMLAFTVRPDGLPGLMETYGIDFAGNISLMVPSMAYYAVANGFVDVAMAMTTDWRIEYYDLVVLEDDGNFFPFYNLAPAIRADALERHPRARYVLESIAARLTDETMRCLSLMVDGDGMSPAEAAERWLRLSGLTRR